MNQLNPFLYLVGGFFVAQIAQRVVVPILVMLLGEKRFASPSAFDGCTLGIAGGFIALFLSILVSAPRGPLYGMNWLPLPAVGVGITLYGLGWLWVLGQGAKKREWRIEGERVLLNSDEGEQELRPSFVRENLEYYQTDAFNGYSHYFLELHDDEKLLATNAYTSKDEFKADGKRVCELTGARRMDLIWLHQVEPKRWMYVTFRPKWKTVLCGSLSLLREDDREWWRGWMYPAFEKRIGETVDNADAKVRVERLRAAYPELLTPPDTVVMIVGRVWADFNFDLDRLLAVDGIIVAVNEARFDAMVREAVGEGGDGHIARGPSGVAELS